MFVSCQCVLLLLVLVGGDSEKLLIGEGFSIFVAPTLWGLVKSGCPIQKTITAGGGGWGERRLLRGHQDFAIRQKGKPFCLSSEDFVAKIPKASTPPITVFWTVPFNFFWDNQYFAKSEFPLWTLAKSGCPPPANGTIWVTLPLAPS